MGLVTSALAEIGRIAASNPSVVTVGAGLGVGVASVGLSEASSNVSFQPALKDKEEKSRDLIDAEKAAAQSKLDAMRATGKDVAIRRQAHDMWRHEPRGPTKYALAQKEQREYEEMMWNRPPQSPEDKKKKGREKVLPIDPPEIRQRGAPKTKPKPPTPPDNKAFEEAMALRGSIYPAPAIREKTATGFHREGSAGPSTAAPSTGAPKTGVSSDGTPSRGGARPHSRRPGESLDVSDEVGDLIADLERSDITKEAGKGHQNDEYKRRSTVLYEKPNLDWLAMELEVFDKELHTKEMGKLRNTKATPTGPSQREKAREERTKLAASKLPEDLLPY